MQCTKCNSDNTQRLEVVFDGGTQNINTTSNSAGAGIGGSFGVGGIRTSTSGTSQTSLAWQPPPTLSRVLNEASGVSPEMALRLSKALGRSAESWLTMQDNYDLWHAKQTLDLANVSKIEFKYA